MCGVGERTPAALSTFLPTAKHAKPSCERKFTATRTTLLNSARLTSGLLLTYPYAPGPRCAAIAKNFENSLHKTFQESAAPRSASRSFSHLHIHRSSSLSFQLLILGTYYLLAVDVISCGYRTVEKFRIFAQS